MLESETLQTQFIFFSNKTEVLKAEALKTQIEFLSKNLKLLNIKVASSAEYSRLKTAFYRLAVKVGLKPTLKSNKFTNKISKKTPSQGEKNPRTKVRDVDTLKDMIFDLRSNLQKNNIVLASSAEYLRLKAAYYRLTKKLGVESSLKLIKSKSKPYDDLSIAKQVKFEKGVDVEAMGGEVLKKANQQPDDSMDLPALLEVLNEKLDKMFSKGNFSAVQRRAISRNAFENLKNNGEIELDEQTLPDDGHPPRERTLADYGITIKHAALAVESAVDRYFRITAQARANYALNKNCGRLKGFFDTAEKKKARQIAISDFLKGEARDFRSEDLIDSEILNDFQPRSANPSSYSEVSIRLQEEIRLAAAEFSRLKIAYNNDEGFDRELWRSYWAADEKRTQLKFKLVQLERAEEVLESHLDEALKSCLESEEDALRTQLEIALGSLTPSF